MTLKGNEHCCLCQYEGGTAEIISYQNTQTDAHNGDIFSSYQSVGPGIEKKLEDQLRVHM